MTYVDEIENDPTIPEDDKARLYPGMYELMLAERRNLDLDDFSWEPTSEQEAKEEELRQWISENHDRLVEIHERYSYLLPF